MKKQFVILTISLCVLLLILNNYVIAQKAEEQQLTKEQLEAFRSAKTVKIDVEQSYGEAKNVSLPIENVIGNILRSVGLKIAGPDAESYDLEIKITAEGKAISEHYTNIARTRIGTHYTGASLSGLITFKLLGTPGYKKTFEGIIGVYPNVQAKAYLTPSEAPFDSSFYESNSVVSKMFEMIGEIYGTNRLLDALKYENRRAQRCLVHALRNIGDSRAVEPLIFIMNNKASLKEEAITALGRIGDSRAVMPLIRALNHRSSAIRFSAAVALGKIGDSRAVVDLIDILNLDKCYGAAGALGEIGDSRAVEALIVALKDKDSYLRKYAAIALGKIGDSRAVEALTVALKDEDSDVREVAVEALGETGDSRAIEALIVASIDKDSEVRKLAVEALGETGDSRAVEALIVASKDKDYNFRELAVEALGKTGDSRAVEALIVSLEDSDYDVMRLAVEALRNIGNSRAIEGLVAALLHEKAYVRRWAVKALEELGWNPENNYQKVSYFIARNHWNECVIMGQTAIEPLITILKSNDKSLRINAVKTLGRIKDSQVLEALVIALKDEDSEVRELTVATLGNIGDPHAIEALISALKDKEWRVSYEARKALSNMEDKWIIEPFIAALKDDDINVRNFAIQNLQERTNKNFGENQKKWQRWWEKNKEKFLKKNKA